MHDVVRPLVRDRCYLRSASPDSVDAIRFTPSLAKTAGRISARALGPDPRLVCSRDHAQLSITNQGHGIDWDAERQAPSSSYVQSKWQVSKHTLLGSWVGISPIGSFMNFSHSNSIETAESATFRSSTSQSIQH